jgi:lipopolysaccharide export LptBFGC system permease protein LptF
METSPRHRRRNQMGMMLLMAMSMIFLMFFVPMGFQFLAALGGK